MKECVGTNRLGKCIARLNKLWVFPPANCGSSPATHGMSWVHPQQAGRPHSSFDLATRHSEWVANRQSQESI